MAERVRDPVHKFIHPSDEEIKIINIPEFQRLRGIHQLALTKYVYPGAVHSRFEHSLGVMEFAGRAFDSILEKDKQQLESNFKKAGITIQEARTVLRLTGLLHDIGHLPFLLCPT